MKKSLVSLSVAAAFVGVAGTATAQVPELVFNPAGVGHILIVPYFSAQSGNATLLNIVNTDTTNGKAVKVRFRGASNSDDIFDFQLFLSPGDVWAASVSVPAGSSLPRLSTGDTSCTLPAKAVLTSTPFITSRLNGALTGDALANETREGYVEILTMANIAPGDPVYTAIKHSTAGVAPCTMSVLETLADRDTRLEAPTTGLFANWTIINVPNTTTWTGEAIAVEAQSAGAPIAGVNVYFPQTATPVGLPTIADLTADPLFQADIVAGAKYDLPDLSTPYFTLTPVAGDPELQRDALSLALAVTTVGAEYLSASSISASTDWVISKPTRRYYAAVDYVDEARVFNTMGDQYYTSTNTIFGNAVNGGKAWQLCTQVSGVQFWNREEVSPSSTGIVISPGQPTPAPSLCGEVSVLGINSPVSPVGAAVSRFNLTLPSGLADGWGTLTATNGGLGLPLILQQFTRATNAAAAPGVSGTFGGVWSGRVIARP